MLDTAEEAFHQIAVVVQVLIELALDEAMTSRRDDGFNVAASKVFEDRVGVVGLVGAKRARMQILKQWQGLWAVAGFTTGEAKSGKTAQPLYQGMNLGAQSAAGSPERLITVFFGAPAAC